jgi:hypothetical protein
LDLTNNEANDDEDGGMEELLSNSIAQDDDEEGAEYDNALETTQNQIEEFRLAPIPLTCGSFDGRSLCVVFWECHYRCQGAPYGQPCDLHE